MQNRKGWSLIGGAVSFGLLVAWMVPPTQPRANASNWRAHISPAAPPAPVDFPGLSPAIAAMRPAPVEQYAYAGDARAQEVAIHRDASTEVTSPAVTDAQDADDGGPDRRAEAASNEDYRWADSRPTGNSRLCDAAPNPEVESRCMAYFDAHRGGPDRDTAVDQSDDEY